MGTNEHWDCVHVLEDPAKPFSRRKMGEKYQQENSEVIHFVWVLLCMPDSDFINRTARLWVATLPWLLHPSTQLAGGRGSETGSKLETIYYCWSRKLIALLLLLPPFWNTPPRETCAEKSLWTNTWRVTEHGPYVVATKNKPKSEMRTVKWIHNVSLYATVTDGQWTVTRQTKTS